MEITMKHGKYPWGTGINFFLFVLVAQRSDVLKNLYLEELRGFKPPSESELVKILGSFTPVDTATLKTTVDAVKPKEDVLLEKARFEKVEVRPLHPSSKV